MKAPSASILEIGDPRLEQVCESVHFPDPLLLGEVQALQEALLAFRREHGFGRAIAAPQLGFLKRFIALNLNGQCFTVVNSKITLGGFLGS